MMEEEENQAREAEQPDPHPSVRENGGIQGFFVFFSSILTLIAGLWLAGYMEPPIGKTIQHTSMSYKFGCRVLDSCSTCKSEGICDLRFTLLIMAINFFLFYLSFQEPPILLDDSGEWYKTYQGTQAAACVIGFVVVTSSQWGIQHKFVLLSLLKMSHLIDMAIAFFSGNKRLEQSRLFHFLPNNISILFSWYFLNTANEATTKSLFFFEFIYWGLVRSCIFCERISRESKNELCMEYLMELQEESTTEDFKAGVLNSSTPIFFIVLTTSTSVPKLIHSPTMCKGVLDMDSKFDGKTFAFSADENTPIVLPPAFWAFNKAIVEDNEQILPMAPICPSELTETVNEWIKQNLTWEECYHKLGEEFPDKEKFQQIKAFLLASSQAGSDKNASQTRLQLTPANSMDDKFDKWIEDTLRAKGLKQVIQPRSSTNTIMAAFLQMHQRMMAVMLHQNNSSATQAAQQQTSNRISFLHWAHIWGRRSWKYIVSRPEYYLYFDLVFLFSWNLLALNWDRSILIVFVYRLLLLGSYHLLQPWCFCCRGSSFLRFLF